MSRMPRAHRLALPLAGALALALTACSGGATSTSTTTSTTGASASTGGGQKLTVFAAASLKKTFTELGKTYEAAHPGTTVSFSFAGSQDLVAQLDQGAPADVLATADQRTMDKATQGRLVVGSPAVFAHNTLTIVTPPGNPKGVKSLADLAKDGVQTVVCAPAVPCGAATQKLEKAAGVTLKPVSEEQAVTDVLGKVEAGQADAGLVYGTDAKGAGAKVTTVPFPEASKAVNTYPIAVTATTRQQQAAQDFVDLVTGAQGQAVLAKAGFAKP